MSYTVIPRT